MLRIPGWTSLDAAARQSWWASARELARALNAMLNAFVVIEPARGEPSGPLNDLPYAAKDMLRTPGHQPSGGLTASPDLAGLSGAAICWLRLTKPAWIASGLLSPPYPNRARQRLLRLQPPPTRTTSRRRRDRGST
jgi:hypothetical protein